LGITWRLLPRGARITAGLASGDWGGRVGDPTVHPTRVRTTGSSSTHTVRRTAAPDIPPSSLQNDGGAAHTSPPCGGWRVGPRPHWPPLTAPAVSRRRRPTTGVGVGCGPGYRCFARVALNAAGRERSVSVSQLKRQQLHHCNPHPYLFGRRRRQADVWWPKHLGNQEFLPKWFSSGRNLTKEERFPNFQSAQGTSSGSINIETCSIVSLVHKRIVSLGYFASGVVHWHNIGGLRHFLNLGP
jgi:hypothetical protein